MGTLADDGGISQGGDGAWAAVFRALNGGLPALTHARRAQIGAQARNTRSRALHVDLFLYAGFLILIYLTADNLTVN